MSARPQTFEGAPPADPLGPLVDIVRGFPSVEKLILHGSRARGDHRPRSDVDLAVVGPDMSDREWWDLTDALALAPTLLFVDVVRYEEAKGAFRDEINRWGKVVYERT